MRKVLSWRFRKYLRDFHMLTVKVCWKRPFLESDLTELFTVRKFGNAVAMTIIFFFKMYKIWCSFRKWKKQSSKSFSVFRYLHLDWEFENLTILNNIFITWSQCLTKIFTFCNFGNTLAMTIILFLKRLKFDVDSGNVTRDWEKVFRFSDNCIWIGSGKFWQSWTGYLSSAENVLTNTHKNSPNSRGDTFQINFLGNDEKAW